MEASLGPTSPLKLTNDDGDDLDLEELAAQYISKINVAEKWLPHDSVEIAFPGISGILLDKVLEALPVLFSYVQMSVVVLSCICFVSLCFVCLCMSRKSL